MKRTISFILTILLTVSMLSVFAFAEDTSGAFDALVDIIDKHSNMHGNLEIEKEGNTLYTLSYYSGRITLEIEADSISYRAFFTKKTNGTFDWYFSGYSSDASYWNGTYRADGTISAEDDINSDVTVKPGLYDDTILPDIVSYVKKMRTLTMIFLREIFIMYNTDYDFDDLGFNPDYFKTVECDAHLYGDYFYRCDATLTKDGTRTAVCQHCGDTDTITAYGSIGGTPNSNFLAFTALVNAIKNAGTLDANNKPAIFKTENNEKYSIIYHNSSLREGSCVEIKVERKNDNYSVLIPASLDGCYKWTYDSGTYSGVTHLAEVENTPARVISDTPYINSVINGVTLLRTKAICYLKEILSQLEVDREFYEYGFNKDYFEKTPDHVCQPYEADPALFEALKNAVIENGKVTYGGYKLVGETDDFYMSLMYSRDTDEFVITIRKHFDYEFVMHINEQSFGLNTCDIKAWNPEFEEPLATTVTTVYDTYNISPTVKISEQPSSDRVDVVENMAEAYGEALALLQMFLEIYEVDAHFSDFGFNEKYFCPQGHEFSKYVYNRDATETEDGTKTATCLECNKKDTVIAEGTAGNKATKTAFDTVTEFLTVSAPDDYTYSVSSSLDDTTVEYFLFYDPFLDVLSLGIDIENGDDAVSYILDINRELDGDYYSYIMAMTPEEIVAHAEAKVPEFVDGEYEIVTFLGDEQEKEGLNDIYMLLTYASMTFFCDFVKTVDPALTLADFGFDKYFMCSPSHLVAEYTYNNDATYEKDGTQTGICYFCNEKETIDAPGTKLVKIVDSSKIFKDVKNKWYKKAVDYCYSYGFMAGVENTRFGLNEPVTRGMFITVLARIAGVDTGKDANKTVTKFNDVKYGKYYTNAIRWASNNGIVNGISKTQFGPEQNITREQICVMLVNFANYLDVEITPRSNPVSFMDSSKISSWAKDAVRTCQKGEIVSGSEQNGRMYFNPKANATRAEAAQMLYKFHDTFF